MTREAQMQLTISDVSKTYSNGVKALDGVSLSIGNGMFGLLGPNGSGKTTLMRTIATLQEPDTGSIRLGAVDILENQHAVRSVLGYLPQDFGVYPNVNAETFLGYIATLKGVVRPSERDAVVEFTLKHVNLWEHRKQRLGTYSGGMKQRLGIAQALVGDPKLIIVDEPTAGLDPEERTRFLNLLSAIGENIIVILSTHIVEDVAEVCDRMAIIREGKLLHTGDPQEAIDAIRGRVWTKSVQRDELTVLEKSHSVISTRLRRGRHVVHVLADSRPDATFDGADPDLKDVYFITLGAAGNGGAGRGAGGAPVASGQGR
jgi:ABC-2 type transport system ATP-binding protein